MLHGQASCAQPQTETRQKGRWFPLCLVFLLLLSAVPAAASSYLDELLARAEALQLHQDRYWQILLHYKPARGGVESLIDDPRFFLAATGKNDPAAELAATLEALFV